MPDRALTRPLRTLVVNPSGVLGGAESWLLSALDATDRLTVEVILLADGPLRNELRERGIPVTVKQVGPRPADIARAAIWLRRELRRRDPDVAVGNGIKAQLALAPAGRSTGVPTVWIKHDHSYDEKLAPWLAKISTKVVATAAEVAVAAKRQDVTVIEPPRPAQPLDPETAKAVLGGLAVPVRDRLLLVMLGRYVPYKGIDTAIRALAEAGTEAWDLLTIGAEEPNRRDERDRLRALANELGVGDRVHLAKYLPAASTVLGAADAVAVLTRPDGPRTPGKEGFGMSAMEAMVAGVPVIATDDGGPVARRIGADAAGGTAGLTVAVDDPEDVARALRQLADPVLRARMGTAGIKRVANHPTSATMAQRVVAVLAEAAHRPGAGLRHGPAISVVSPVLNEAANIDRLITPIVAALAPGDEYLLVDGGSTDGTRERIERWSAEDSRIKLVKTPGGTIANSRNLGIDAAHNQFIACTDAGCDPGPHWIDGMRAAAAETALATERGDSGTGLFVGAYRAAVRPGRVFEQAMAAVSWPDPEELRRATLFRAGYARLFGRAFSAKRVDGRSVGFRREVWAAAGGFPEHLRTAEDEAFGRALLGTGATSAITLDAEVTWHQRTSVAATFRQFKGYGRGGATGRSKLLLGRDAARLVGYLAGIALAVFGGVPGVVLALAGGLGYLSLPFGRVVRRRHWLALPLVPVAQALKDVAKMTGAASAMLTVGRPRRMVTKARAAAVPSRPRTSSSFDTGMFPIAPHLASMGEPAGWSSGFDSGQPTASGYDDAAPAVYDGAAPADYDVAAPAGFDVAELADETTDAGTSIFEPRPMAPSGRGGVDAEPVTVPVVAVPDEAKPDDAMTVLFAPDADQNPDPIATERVADLTTATIYRTPPAGQ